MATTLNPPDADLITALDYEEPPEAGDAAAFSEVTAHDQSFEERAYDFLAQANKLLALQPGWDSYGGHLPSRQTLQDACDLFVYLAEGVAVDRRGIEGTVLLRPLASGGVQIDWSCDFFDLEVELSPTRAVSFYFESRSGSVLEGESDELQELILEMRQARKNPDDQTS